jgi:hypothetical protein
LLYEAIKNHMPSYTYRIAVKTTNGIIIAKYKSPEKLQTGEEIILIYKGKSNLVKVTTVHKGGTAEAEEI